MDTTTTSKGTKTQELYRQLTERVIAELESNPTGWTKPWADAFAHAGIPFNATTGVAYQGGNVMWLALVAADAGHEGLSAWATYRQWGEAGCQVRKGSTGTKAARWNPVRCKPAHAADERCTSCGKLFPSVFTLFHFSQVEGGAEYVEARYADKGSRHDPIAAAEAFIAGTGAVVRWDPTRAYYSPGGDFIGLPALEQFDSPARYYGTAVHELGHWTGHRSRLNREGITGGHSFGSAEYAFEELVAELTAVLVGVGHLGLEVDVRDDHASYLASWLRALKADPSLLWKAAGKAGKAADFLVALQPAEAEAEPVAA